MDTLTLTRNELIRLLKGFGAAVLLVGLFSFLVLLRSTSLLSAAFRAFAPAITGASIIFAIFISSAWRITWIAKWMGRPILRGVWLGLLSSDYRKSPDDKPVRIPIMFVIRQSYLTLSVQSLAEKQTGESRVESLIRNARTETTRLAYLFELKTLYPGQRTVTRGAGELELLSLGTVLSGIYWTDSPTHGTLRLRLQCRDYKGIETFADARRRWPDGSVWDTSRESM